MAARTADGFAFFPTALGRCALAWNAEGIVGVHLPDVDERAMEAHLRRRFPKARESTPPAAAARAIDRISALMAGARDDLSDLALDLRGIEAFHRRVYDVARTIAPGTTLTYGDVAERLGDRTLARSVGQALAANPFAIVVPCHRVLAADGKLGGFSASGGPDTKRRMLVLEGALAAPEPSLFGDLDR